MARRLDERSKNRRGAQRDQDNPTMRAAHGRYSASEQAEDRSRRDGGGIDGAHYTPGEGSHGAGMEREGGAGASGGPRATQSERPATSRSGPLRPRSRAPSRPS